MPVTPTPRLQIFPTEDVAFRRYVTDTFAAMQAALATRRPRSAVPVQATDLQWRIRDRYPAAVVRQRDPLADPGDGGPLWYVYRYGSVVPGRRWWEEPGHAWAILDDERRFVEVSTSLTEIVEAPASEICGRPIEDFANPDDASAKDDVRELWSVLRERGELHATLRYRHLDGSPRQIEFHVTRNGAGSARHLAVVREIDAG